MKRTSPTMCGPARSLGKTSQDTASCLRARKGIADHPGELAGDKNAHGNPQPASVSRQAPFAASIRSTRIAARRSFERGRYRAHPLRVEEAHWAHAGAGWRVIGAAAALAGAKGVAPSYVSRVLRLTLLAPDVVEAIPDGRQLAELQLDDRLEGFPLEWARQAQLLAAWRLAPALPGPSGLIV